MVYILSFQWHYVGFKSYQIIGNKAVSKPCSIYKKKDNIKSLHPWPFLRGIHCGFVSPRASNAESKRFHFMTSSWCHPREKRLMCLHFASNKGIALRIISDYIPLHRISICTGKEGLVVNLLEIGWISCEDTRPIAIRLLLWWNDMWTTWGALIERTSFIISRLEGSHTVSLHCF